MVLFQILVRNHHFQLFCGHLKAKIWSMWPKNESILKLSQQVYTPSLKRNARIFFSDNGRKLRFCHFVVNRGPQFGQCNQNATQFWPVTEQVCTPSFNWVAWTLFPDNGRKTQSPVIFVANRWPKSGQCGQKANQSWTHTQLVYTLSSYGIVWTLFEIMVRNHHFHSFSGH